MKKALAVLLLELAYTLAMAQGDIVANNQTGQVKQWTSRSNPTLISVPKSGGSVQIIAAPVGTPLPHPLLTVFESGEASLNYSTFASFLTANPGWEPISVYHSSTPATPTPMLVSGIFSGSHCTINNIALAASANYFAIGWTGSYTTADAALAAALLSQDVFLGQSAMATTLTADGTTIPPQLPVALKSTFPGLVLIPVIPEPSMGVLTLLAVWLVSRRSRAQ